MKEEEESNDGPLGTYNVILHVHEASKVLVFLCPTASRFSCTPPSAIGRQSSMPQRYSFDVDIKNVYLRHGCCDALSLICTTDLVSFGRIVIHNFGIITIIKPEERPYHID